MKYIFDVDERNNKFSIRIEIQKGNAFNANASSIVECSEEKPNWDKDLELMLQELIDNMRLTVNERTEARRNANILIEYLKYSNPVAPEQRHQMIVENGDPAVLVKENNQ